MPHEIFPFPPVTYPHSTEPLIEQLADVYEVHAHCNTRGCSHRGQLNLVALARRLGPNHSSLAGALVPRLACLVCKEAGRPAKNLGLIVTPPTGFSQVRQAQT